MIRTGIFFPNDCRLTSFVMFLIALFSLIVFMSLFISVQHFSLLIASMLIKVTLFFADQTNELTVLVIKKERFASFLPENLHSNCFYQFNDEKRKTNEELLNQGQTICYRNPIIGTRRPDQI